MQTAHPVYVCGVEEVGMHADQQPDALSVAVHRGVVQRVVTLVIPKNNVYEYYMYL